MHLSYRRFGDPGDTERVIAFVSRMARWNEGGIGWIQPGDIVWRLYQNLTIDPAETMRIVEDAGEMVALVEVGPPDCFYMHIPEDCADLSAVVRFTEERARQDLLAMPPAEGGSSPEAIETEATSLQADASALLKELGYASAGDPGYRLNGQPLNGDVAAPQLADGAIVRAVHDTPDDVQKRVELHRDVWAPSKFDLAGYERLRTKPLYRPDLDLVVETPDGELAAYCIVWWDPVTNMGEFEPVGTAELFRRRGYGRAVLQEGLRRLRDLGAEYATVLNSMDGEHTPSRFLYPAAGFETVLMFERLSRPV